jgi:hypothetical protein
MEDWRMALLEEKDPYALWSMYLMTLKDQDVLFLMLSVETRKEMLRAAVTHRGVWYLDLLRDLSKKQKREIVIEVAPSDVSMKHGLSMI